jgi:two-component system OmpR family sensor kinase
MSIRRQLTVRAKLSATFGFLVALVLLVAVLALHSLSAANEDFKLYVDGVDARSWVAEKIRISAAQRMADLADLSAATTAEGAAAAQSRLDTADQALLNALHRLQTMVSPPTDATPYSRSLVAQIDDKLRTEGAQLASQQVSALLNGLNATSGPSDYYVRLMTDAGDTAAVWGWRPTLARYGTTHLPNLTTSQVAARAGAAFTVPSDLARSHWRAVTYQTSAGGSVVIALPLAGTRDTTETMVAVLLLSGAGILLLGALAAGWAVRRSLRPLVEIEHTAAAIAAGDLSRRVPALPESTEVGRLGASLNGMLAQIEQAFAARTASEARMRQFVADASHELRTPLATIRGYAELYRMGALDEPAKVDDTMRRIEGSAARMGGLVEDLLLLARLDEGRPVAHEPVDLTVLAADAVSDLHALDPDRPARLVPLGPGAAAGPVVVTGDDGRLRQVVANLVGNVVRHTPAGTPVEIAVGTADGAGVLEVRDHGPGIDPAHAARVFERFYRVDKARSREMGGTGLGLSIVKHAVEQLHGTVEVESRIGCGSRFTVRLPRLAQQS